MDRFDMTPDKERGNTMESNKKDILFDLRDSRTVTIPIERLVELVDCETRLNVLRQSRIREIITTSYQSVSDRDFILGKPVMDEWERNQAVERGNA